MIEEFKAGATVANIAGQSQRSWKTWKSAASLTGFYLSVVEKWDELRGSTGGVDGITGVGWHLSSCTGEGSDRGSSDSRGVTAANPPQNL